MIFNTEDLLGKVYKTYQLHQAKHNLPFMKLEDFRLMFEDQQEIIVNEIEEEEADGDSSY